MTGKKLMAGKKRGFRFLVVMVFALTMVRTGMASITRVASADSTCSPLISKAGEPSALRFKFVNYVSFLVESLSMPVSSGTMNSYEKMKLADLYERKKEILDYLRFYVSDRKLYVEKRNLPLLGAIGAMLETAASVRHLWSSNLQWLRFKSYCKSGQALAARLRAMKTPSFYQPAQAGNGCNKMKNVDEKRL